LIFGTCLGALRCGHPSLRVSKRVDVQQFDLRRLHASMVHHFDARLRSPAPCVAYHVPLDRLCQPKHQSEFDENDFIAPCKCVVLGCIWISPQPRRGRARS
jgi:hypothetical protein